MVWIVRVSVVNEVVLEVSAPVLLFLMSRVLVQILEAVFLVMGRSVFKMVFDGVN